MTVTTTDVVTLLQGEPNGIASPDDGWILYRIYDTKRLLIQKYIDMVTRWATEEISLATRTAKPLLFDDLILNYVCYRILAGHIMGQIMATGFSFTSLEFTVNAQNFPSVVTNGAESFMMETKKILLQLHPRVDIDYQTMYGEDAYGVSAYYIDSTYKPYGL